MIHVHENKKKSSLAEDKASDEPNKGRKKKQNSTWFGKQVIQSLNH